MLITTVSGQTTRDEIASWTWSQKLAPGIYKWNVSSFSVQGESINIKNNPTDIIEGSAIDIQIDELLFGFDYHLIINDTSLLPMTTFIDGHLRKMSDLFAVEFIYPNLIGWSNGTFSNIFELDQPAFRDVLHFSNTSRQEGRVYILEFKDELRYSRITRNIDTGLLEEWLLRTQGGNELIYEYIGFMSAKVSEDSLLNIQLLAFPVIALPIIIYSKTQRIRRRFVVLLCV